MEKAVKLLIRKDLRGVEQQKIIKLKGYLISKRFTEIIHIMDHDQEFHINYFETSNSMREEVQHFINSYLADADLENAVFIK